MRSPINTNIQFCFSAMAKFYNPSERSPQLPQHKRSPPLPQQSDRPLFLNTSDRPLFLSRAIAPSTSARAIAPSPLARPLLPTRAIAPSTIALSCRPERSPPIFSTSDRPLLPTKAIAPYLQQARSPPPADQSDRPCSSKSVSEAFLKENRSHSSGFPWASSLPPPCQLGDRVRLHFLDRQMTPLFLFVEAIANGRAHWAQIPLTTYLNITKRSGAVQCWIASRLLNLKKVFIKNLISLLTIA